MDYNRVIIVGRLTRDPELRALPSGSSVTTFSVATGRVWKDRDGNKKEDTQFHNVVVFGKQAETVAQYLKKGQEVLVEGRLQTRSWDDKTSGEKKSRTEIVADRVQFGAKSTGASGGEHPVAKGAKGPGEATPQSGEVEYPEENINPEDIPF